MKEQEIRYQSYISRDTSVRTALYTARQLMLQKEDRDAHGHAVNPKQPRYSMKIPRKVEKRENTRERDSGEVRLAEGVADVDTRNLGKV